MNCSWPRIDRFIMFKSLIFILSALLFSCSNLKTSDQNNLLRFQTDDNYLVLYLLVNTKSNRISNQSYSQDILNFQNKVWNENRAEYEILLKNIKKPSQLTYLNFKEYFEESNLSLIDKCKPMSEFQILKKQTDIYKEQINEIWNDHFLKTQTLIVSMTGLELNKKNQVIITHPGLKNGRELKGQWIEWGGYDDPNYVVTYLWHETLHAYFDKSNLSHSIIELISDNELNKTLTKNDYPPLRGHQQLNQIKNCLLDEWRQYLSSTPKNIINFTHSEKVTKCGELFKDLHVKATI